MGRTCAAVYRVCEGTQCAVLKKLEGLLDLRKYLAPSLPCCGVRSSHDQRLCAQQYGMFVLICTLISIP